MITLHHGSCLEVLPKIGQCDMIFADSFDNINLKYQGFKDSMPDNEYESFLMDVVAAMWKYAPISWMSFNAKWLGMVGDIANWYPKENYRFFIQTFTFGTNRRRDFVNGFRPILRLMHDNVTTYPEKVYVESWRQKHGDKRAAEGGKMPDDVWDFPRVTGNSKQRRAWSPCQLHEDLYARCLRFSVQSGAKVCDLFAGSGTLARVAGETHDVHLIELSSETVQHIYKEHKCDPYCYLPSCSVCY